MNTGKSTPKLYINPIVKAIFVPAPKQTIQAHAESFLCDGSPSQQNLQTTKRHHTGHIPEAAYRRFVYLKLSYPGCQRPSCGHTLRASELNCSSRKFSTRPFEARHPLPRRGGTPLHGLNGDVRPDRVWFSEGFVLNGVFHQFVS